MREWIYNSVFPLACLIEFCFLHLSFRKVSSSTVSCLGQTRPEPQLLSCLCSSRAGGFSGCSLICPHLSSPTQEAATRQQMRGAGLSVPGAPGVETEPVWGCATTSGQQVGLRGPEALSVSLGASFEQILEIWGLLF